MVDRSNRNIAHPGLLRPDTSVRWRAPEPERHLRCEARPGRQPALAKAAHERASSGQGIVT